MKNKIYFVGLFIDARNKNTDLIGFFCFYLAT
jgi:hypothetical protein